MVPPVRRRGLTLVEFMLALAITGLISAAVAAMMTSVARATESDRHFRETLVRSQALNIRFTSYITPSLYILMSDESSVVLWFDDWRWSGTVHTTEVRWIDWDESTNTVRLQYVKFPDGMSQLEKDLLDLELPANSNWWAVLATMDDLGYIAMERLCDGVADFAVERDTSTEQGRRLITAHVTYAEHLGGATVVLGASVREWLEPML